MKDIKKHLEYIEYIEKLEKINQSITVINKENKAGKKLCKKLKRMFRGGIDGWNNGATFCGILPFGKYSIVLTDSGSGYYFSYYDYMIQYGVSCTVSPLMIFEVLKSINAVKKAV